MTTREKTANAPTQRLDISEQGKLDGEAISLDKRLFIQLLAFTAVHETEPLVEALSSAGIDAVLFCWWPRIADNGDDDRIAYLLRKA